MAVRNVVKIDEEKCNGCGQCVDACVEGAIEIVDGKARLISETYCDGLGACIGHCPQDAITVERRDAPVFDEEATKQHLAEMSKHSGSGFVCPGMIAKELREKGGRPAGGAREQASRLSHWPVQLRLVSPQASYFAGAELLVVADCVPFAMGDFHNRFLTGRSVVVGCPKLDDVGPHVDKLTGILKANELVGLTVIHMEVPCCSGLTRIARDAVARSGKKIPFTDITVTLTGEVALTETVKP
jgi:Pyruvate/2-oxoacid:ferredoxin oxidoreductase delta subunit